MLDLADLALKIDPRHAGAMATRGWIFYVLRRGGDADTMAGAGLAIEPRNVPLLRLKSRLLTDAAAALAGQAAGLRAGHTESHVEQRSDGEYRVTEHYPPTAEQVAEAQALEARAAELRRQAAGVDTQAQRVETEVVPALLKRGDAALAAGDADAARGAFTEAYALQPDTPGLDARLAEVCKRQGDGAGSASTLCWARRCGKRRRRRN